MNVIALFNPLGTRTFGVPIFEENDRYYTQVLCTDDLITDFDICSVPKNCLTVLEAPRDVSIEQQEYFASSCLLQR
jgi:hypothetical protein